MQLDAQRPEPPDDRHPPPPSGVTADPGTGPAPRGPAALPGAPAVAPAASPAAPAGLPRRLLALLVDLALLRALLTVLAGAGDLLLPELPLILRAFELTCVLVVPSAYFALSHGTQGRSAGKWLFGLRVLTVAGGSPGYGRALVRFWALVPSLGVFALGAAVALLRSDRRAFHDLVAGTRVVRWPARTHARPVS